MKVLIREKRFGDEVVLRNVSLEIREHKTTLIMAPSGWGKTTLLRILLSLDKDYDGELSDNEGRSVILFQENRLVEDISALSNLRALGKDRKECLSILSELGLGDMAEKKVRELSGGEKRRLAIARMLLVEGERYFLDEPFSGLDDDTRERTASLIREGLKGKTVVLVSHNREDGVLLGAEEKIEWEDFCNGREN